MRLPIFAGISTNLQQWQASDVERAVAQVATATINVVSPVIAKRQTSSTCAPNDTSAACAKPTDSNGSIQTVAIALGAGYVPYRFCSVSANVI